MVNKRGGEYVEGWQETHSMILRDAFGIFGLCANGSDK